MTSISIVATRQSCFIYLLLFAQSNLLYPYSTIALHNHALKTQHGYDIGIEKGQLKKGKDNLEQQHHIGCHVGSTLLISHRKVWNNRSVKPRVTVNITCKMLCW
jgi:hypothetical protein